MIATWLVIGVALASHFGVRLAAYNRLNSFGWRRVLIKRTEIALLVETLLTPVLLGWLFTDELTSFATGQSSWESLPQILRCISVFTIAPAAVLGILWLLWRPIFGVEHAGASRQVETIDVASAVEVALPRTRKCRLAKRLPGNQIFDMAIERISLPVANLPPALEGYRIAHLSDLHLTGQIDPTFHRFAIDRAMQWQPDLMALTGDIVDKPIGVGWIADLMSPATAPDGCHFVLGNHDTRIGDPETIRQAMRAAGWNDVSAAATTIVTRGQRVALVGNESPWFPLPSLGSPESLAAADFRICLSHSPDQFDWCRARGIELMLAGHTHGGQGRLPLAGPLLSPSWHGSRWASGDFFRPPTTLHVSRGLSGVHLLRIRCRPELSLVTLRRRPGVQA